MAAAVVAIALAAAVAIALAADLALAVVAAAGLAIALADCRDLNRKILFKEMKLIRIRRRREINEEMKINER